MGCVGDKVKPQAIRVRIALIGEQQSGKTALILAFLRKKFDMKYTHTTGSNICVKSFFFRDCPLATTLEIWELNHPNRIPIDCDFVVLALDASLPISQLNQQLARFDRELGLKKRLSRFVVALTKADMLSGGVKQAELVGKNLQVEQFSKVYVTSAKSGLGIDEMFLETVKPPSLPLSRRTSVSSSD